MLKASAFLKKTNRAEEVTGGGPLTLPMFVSCNQLGGNIMDNIATVDSDLSRRKKYAFYALTAYVLFAFLAVTSGPAWSFEVNNTDPHGVSGVTAPIVSVPDAPPAGDECLYILRIAKERDSTSAMDREYRQAAGSAAAIGLVFGVRFALGPQEVSRNGKRRAPKASFNVWETRDHANSGQALAIADYRACRNERALQALTD